MKILYIHDEQVHTEKANVIQVLHMCNAFSELGNEVILLVPANRKSTNNINSIILEKINKEISFRVITYQKLRVKKIFNMLGGYFGVKKALKTLNADYCIVRNPLFLILSLKFNFKTIFESHNSRLHERFKLLNILWKKIIISQSKKKNFIKMIAISNALAKFWTLNKIPQNKIIALHDGFDLESYLFIREQKSLRKDLCLPLKRKIVTYAGSLYVNRGIKIILQLAKLFSKVLFVVVGGPEKNILLYTKLCDTEGIKNIKFIGPVPHFRVKDYLSASDVLLMIWSKDVKTINYCSPLKMFEYMASGRIIVGHSFPTIREVLTDQHTALLSDPDSFDNLKEKLSIAIDQHYPNKIANNARKLAIESYTWKMRAQKIIESISKNYNFYIVN